MFSTVQYDSAGNKYVSIFNGETSGPQYSYVEDINGKIISETIPPIIIETPISVGSGELLGNEIDNWRLTFRNSLGWS